MSRLTAHGELAALQLALSAAVLLWDIVLSGRIARWRGIPRSLAAVSAIAGLVIAPALLIHIATGSVLDGRALWAAEWAWPATAALVAVQAVYALERGFTAPAIGIPIAVYDCTLAVLHGAQYAAFLGARLPAPLLTLSAAAAGVFGMSGVPLVRLAPYFVLVPILAPISPGRRGFGTALRGAVSALATVWLLLIVVQLPAAVRALRSYAGHERDELRERAQTDFSVGLKILPTLVSVPTAFALENDLQLADSLDVQLVSVYLAPGVASATLDSLARALAQSRPDRRLLVALDFGDAGARRPNAEGYLRARVADVERVARRLRPDYLVPVIDPLGAGNRVLGRLSPVRWERYLSEAALAARRRSPNTRVLVHVGGAAAGDSTLFAWAAAPGSPMSGAGFDLLAGWDGAGRLRGRMDAADRWLSAVQGGKELWVIQAGSNAAAHGQDNQARAIWSAITWATNRPAVRGLIVLQASDYGPGIGLRVAGGRLRPAAALVQRAAAAIGGAQQPSP